MKVYYIYVRNMEKNIGLPTWLHWYSKTTKLKGGVCHNEETY